MTTTLWTNALTPELAATLADARHGFAGIIYRLGGKKQKGVVRGQHLVHDVFFLKRHYGRSKGKEADVLLSMDNSILRDLAAEGHLAWDNPRRKDAVQVKITLQDLHDAWLAMIDSAMKSAEGTNKATHDHVYEPLVVNGKTVRGAKVYIGHATDPSKNKAEPGTIYLTGLKVSRKVLERDPNGDILPSKSGIPATCKQLIRRRLDLTNNRFVQYKLAPGGEWALSAGQAAEVAAKDDGVTIDPAEVEAVKVMLAA